MILKTKKADVRFAKIDADLLTKSRFFSRVPGGIRTPDLPLRSGYRSCSFSMLSMSLNACIYADVFNV